MFFDRWKNKATKLGNPRIIYNSSCELLHDLIQPIGEDREDEDENESFFGRDGMDFRHGFSLEEAGGAAEGGFDALSVVALWKGHMRLIPARTRSLDYLEFHLLLSVGPVKQ